MNQKHLKGWLKHGDFILLDILCLQVSFVLSFWALRGFGNPYRNASAQFQIALLFVCQLLVILLFNNYGGILRRGLFDEAVAVVKYMAIVLLFALVYLFAIHGTAAASRLQIGVTAVVFVALDYVLRLWNKRRIFRVIADEDKKRSLVLITSPALVEDALLKLYRAGSWRDFRVTGILLMGEGMVSNVEQYEIPIQPLNSESVRSLAQKWVDEVFILQPEDQLFPKALLGDLMTMGITVHYAMSAFDMLSPFMDSRKLGDFKVMTTSVRFADAQQMLFKRLIDIIGGLVGCLCTGILYLFVAPAIRRADPGPIFFTQDRIGENGKVFKMHKFRSMYMDAEERKATLMEQNKIADSMMFKMDDDPRILGSEKKDKNGKPMGIGNFIRNTSIDEFPQFYDVLIGNMSLVGWRPATLDEWEKYDLQHRIRASMKPGITGMWQVSGRSEITDFNEVVRLDREYIENWSLLLDLKILLKTVWVVARKRGAE